MPKIERVEFSIPCLSSMFPIAEYEQSWLENFILSNVDEKTRKKKDCSHTLNYISLLCDEEIKDSYRFDGSLVFNSLHFEPYTPELLQQYRISNSVTNFLNIEFAERSGVCRGAYNFHQNKFNMEKFGSQLSVGIAIYLSKNSDQQNVYYVLTAIQDPNNLDNIVYNVTPVFKTSLKDILKQLDGVFKQANLLLKFGE